MEINYEKVQPLLVKEEIEGNQLNCQFKASNQDQPVDAFHVFEPETKDVVKDAGKKAVKRSFFSGIMRFFGSAAGSAVGGGMAGSATRSAVRSSGNAAYNEHNKKNQGVQMNISEDMKKEGVVEAFKTVEAMYEADENGAIKFKS